MNTKYVEIDGFQKDTGLANDMLKELYMQFVQDLNEEKKKLNQCVTLETIELPEILHNIKGLSSNYKATRVFELADSLHKKIKNQDIADCQYYLLALSEVINETSTEIVNYFE